METIQFHYARNGQRFGPVTIEELRAIASRGELAGSDLVWRSGLPDWVQARSIVELGLPATAPPPLPTPAGDLGDEVAMRLLLPVGRSGWAIAAGYLGLFALIVFPAPLALGAGIIACVHLKRNKKLHGWGRAIFGLVMGALGTTVLVGGIIIAIMDKGH